MSKMKNTIVVTLVVLALIVLAIISRATKEEEVPTPQATVSTVPSESPVPTISSEPVI